MLNELLDKIGLTKKDPQGLRLRTDNGQVLRLTVTTVAAAFLPAVAMVLTLLDRSSRTRGQTTRSMQGR